MTKVADGLYIKDVIIFPHSSAAVTLLSNASATGSAVTWSGGKGTYYLEGTLGGATVTLQYRPAGSTAWTSAGQSSILTAAGTCNFEAAAGEVRVLVAGGSPSALYAMIIPYSA